MKELMNHIEKVQKAMRELTEYCTSGDIQSFQCFAEIKEKNLEDFFKTEIKKIKDQGIESLQNFFLEGNSKIYKDESYIYTLRNGSTRYYYTNVEEVQQQKKKLESSKEFKKLKEIEYKYKTAFLLKQKGQYIIDDKTEDFVDPSKVNVVYSSQSLNVKLR